jgi:hypothetical protein
MISDGALLEDNRELMITLVSKTTIMARGNGIYLSEMVPVTAVADSSCHSSSPWAISWGQPIRFFNTNIYLCPVKTKRSPNFFTGLLFDGVKDRRSCANKFAETSAVWWIAPSY